MPGLSAGLNIGLSGLTAAQTAINVVGHNIANVNTPGYSQESALLATNPSQLFGNINYGSGVNLEGIQGVRDQLLNQALVASNSQQSGSQTIYQGLQATSSVFQDNGTTGLQTQLNSFFTSIQKMAAQPEDASLRTNVVGSAQTLLTSLQTDYQSLQTAQTSADQQVSSLIPQVNTLTKQIAALNQKIGSEGAQGTDNDAIDQRQQLVNQLGQLVGIQTYTDNNNNVNITLDGGTAPLVVGITSYDLTQGVTSTSNPPLKGIASSLNPGVDISGSIVNGQMGGQLALRDTYYPGYMKQLDTMTAGLAYNMNKLQSAGYAQGAAAPSGLNFFVSTTDPTGATGMTNGLPSNVQVPPDVPPAVAANDYKGTVMGLTINSQIVANPSLLAAATTAGAAGDNTNALAMAALQTQAGTVDATGAGPAAAASGPFSTFLTGLFTQAGNDVSNWNTTYTNQQNITTGLTTQQQSVSGVDLDTQAANLITFQNGYQASARFVTVVSTLMQQLITTFGQ